MELQEELDYTLKRIDQLQRGITTPVRRKPLNASGSRGYSPYQRNSSGSKKGTPGNSATRPGGGVPSYAKPTRNLSNQKFNPANNYPRKPSPITKVPANYVPPHLRQTSNNRTSPAPRNLSNNRSNSKKIW